MNDELISYPNFKMEILAKILGPWIEFLDDHNISDGWPFVLFFGLYFYLTVYRHRSKSRKYNFFEKFLIGSWIGLAIFCVIHQIILIVIF